MRSNLDPLFGPNKTRRKGKKIKNYDSYFCFPLFGVKKEGKKKSFRGKMRENLSDLANKILLPKALGKWGENHTSLSLDLPRYLSLQTPLTPCYPFHNPLSLCSHPLSINRFVRFVAQRCHHRRDSDRKKSHRVGYTESLP